MSDEQRIWTCKIGGNLPNLPDGADTPMREATRRAYKELTGVEAEFSFTGWGGTLDERERDELGIREDTP